MSATPQGKVHCPWVLFCKATLLLATWGRSVKQIWWSIDSRHHFLKVRGDIKRLPPMLATNLDVTSWTWNVMHVMLDTRPGSPSFLVCIERSGQGYYNRCLAHNVIHYLHHFDCLVVHNIDNWHSLVWAQGEALFCETTTHWLGKGSSCHNIIYTQYHVQYHSPVDGWIIPQWTV